MQISRKLKQENIAEYLLYMWQVEDLIRAYGLDIERIDSEYIAKFQLDQEQHEEMREWYANLIEMMRSEDVAEKGHIQINKNVIIWLIDTSAIAKLIVDIQSAAKHRGATQKGREP